MTIYLFTFVVAFARAKRRLSRAPTVAAVMLAFPAMLDTRITADGPAGFRLPLHLSLLLAVGLAAHLGLGRPALGALARRYGTLGRAVVPLLGAAVVSVTVLTLDRSGQDRLASAAALTGIPLVAG